MQARAEALISNLLLERRPRTMRRRSSRSGSTSALGDVFSGTEPSPRGLPGLLNQARLPQVRFRTPDSHSLTPPGEECVSPSGQLQVPLFIPRPQPDLRRGQVSIDE